MDLRSKIYVAGHGGLVGSAIMRALEGRGYTNLITRPHADLDLCRQDETERFFRDELPEYVFLAAARVGGIAPNMAYPAEFIYENLAIATSVIHSSYLSGVKKLLNLGSSCIFPTAAPQPLKEEYLLTGGLEPTNEAYAIAKVAAIKLCRYYNQQYGTNYLSVMPTNLYGTQDNFNLETAHVLPALVRKFHLAKLLMEGRFDLIRADLRRHKLGFGLDAGIDPARDSSLAGALERIGIGPGHVTLWGTGEPFREFLHVDDLASAVVFLMERYDYREIGEFINIGAGEDLRIKDMALLIRDIVGYRGDIHHDTTRPDGMKRKLLDSGRIRGLGWKPRYNLAEGIEKTYRWYVADQQNR
jgi:GDP-L-fucose synthase